MSENRKLRLMVVGTRPPRLPLHDGYVLHLHHLLTGVAERHEVRFLAIDDDRGPFTDIAGLSSGIIPDHTTSLRTSLRRQVADFRPEVVHAVGAPLARLLRDVPDGIGTVLGALDAPHLNIDAIEAHGIMPRIRKSARRTLALWTIRHAYQDADAVVVVSDEDRRALERENSRVTVSVIPNGVDVEAFAQRPFVSRRPDHLLFTGALGYPPNVATAVFLAREVFPIIRAQRPSAELSLVGRAPSPEVLALAKIPGVEVVGPVDEMVDALGTASVYLCPMVSGTGIKNKLLEAMANGLPCVATQLAVRGTELQNGRDVLLAERPDEVAEAALRLLSDEALRDQIGRAGLDYVTSRHTWSAMVDRYSAVYERVLTAGDAVQP